MRDDGRVGLLYFDLRPDTADTGTLLAASWLASSSDGLAWDEAAVWSAFDMARAPNARGLFLGDYMGLVPDGARYFDVHHAARDTLDAVSPRELQLGTAAMAALSVGSRRSSSSSSRPASCR